MTTTDSRSTESGDAAESTVRTAAGHAVAVAKYLVTVAVTAGWTVFWLTVARLHYSRGSLLDAGFTVAVLVVPPLAGLGWYALSGVSLPESTPSLGGTASQG